MFYGAVYKYYSFIDVDICVHVWVQQYKLLYNQRHLWLNPPGYSQSSLRSRTSPNQSSFDPLSTFREHVIISNSKILGTQSDR